MDNLPPGVNSIPADRDPSHLVIRQWVEIRCSVCKKSTKIELSKIHFFGQKHAERHGKPTGGSLIELLNEWGRIVHDPAGIVSQEKLK